LHRHNNVFLRDGATGICVKLGENSLKVGLIKELFHIHSSDDKLGIIDFVVSVVIDLVDNFINLCVRNIDLALFNGLLELISIDHMSAIFIDSFEVFFKIFNLSLVSHFYKHICGSLLQFRNTFVFPESHESFYIELSTDTTLSSFLEIFHPRMI